MLAIVPYPTLEESAQNWDKLTDKEKQEVTARKNWLARYEAASLKSVGQLPELEGDELSLEWGMIEAKSGQKVTLIRHGAREVSLWSRWKIRSKTGCQSTLGQTIQYAYYHLQPG
jgi:hypothetical protein